MRTDACVRSAAPAIPPLGWLANASLEAAADTTVIALEVAAGTPLTRKVIV